MPEQMTGGCACGRVRYTATVNDDDAYLCHCRMCQRSTKSVSIAFKNVKQADVAWENEPQWYDSSAIARRPFCAHCGTSLGFQFKEGSENMDLTVASFDEPSRFVPTHHFGAESMHRQWLTPKAYRNSAPRNMARWSTNGSRRRASFRGERAMSAFDPLRTLAGGPLSAQSVRYCRTQLRRFRPPKFSDP